MVWKAASNTEQLLKLHVHFWLSMLGTLVLKGEGIGRIEEFG